MAEKVLYHGTIHLFSSVDTSKGKGYKDFGPGFYTTGVRKHAVNLARRNKQIEFDRLRILGVNNTNIRTYIYEYLFDTNYINIGSCRIFKAADMGWVNFIILNRENQFKAHTYEIVQGPTADDDTNLTLNNFRRGIFGDPSSQMAKQILLQLLAADKLPVQTYFGTDAATSKLKFIRRSVVE